MSMKLRLLAALGAANIALILPLAALAQDDPTYAQQPGAPQYAQAGVPSYATQDQQIHGRIASFDGGYNLQVRDDKGYLDNVQLHQGTVINPTGLTLAPGMVVSVNGYSQGSYFAANEIDTPYQLYGAVPYYSGHPWYYYGPSISWASSSVARAGGTAVTTAVPSTGTAVTARTASLRPTAAASGTVTRTSQRRSTAATSHDALRRVVRKADRTVTAARTAEAATATADLQRIDCNGTKPAFTGGLFLLGTRAA